MAMALSPTDEQVRAIDLFNLGGSLAIQAGADGKITADEFTAQVAERAGAERQRRRDHYGDGPVHDVTCEACGAEREWDENEEGGELPPVYFECEDLDGVSCQDDEEPVRYQGEGDWSDGS